MGCVVGKRLKTLASSFDIVIVAYKFCLATNRMEENQTKACMLSNDISVSLIIISFQLLHTHAGALEPACH